MFFKNSGNFGDALGILVCAVIRWHNAFRFGSVEMRTPIGNDSVAAVRCVSTSPITDDRVYGTPFAIGSVFMLFTKRLLGKSVSTLLGIRVILMTAGSSWTDASKISWPRVTKRAGRE